MIDEPSEDIILNINSLLNTERHFRRRKRRTSLTKSSSSIDETDFIKTDSIEKTDYNQEEKSQDPIDDSLQQISIEALSLNDNNEKQEDNEEVDNETNTSNRIRGRSKQGKRNI